MFFCVAYIVLLSRTTGAVVDMVACQLLDLVAPGSYYDPFGYLCSYLCCPAFMGSLALCYVSTP